MTGPEHYREAERLMEAAIGKPTGGDLVQLAQVHATLALTAVSAEANVTAYSEDNGLGPGFNPAWVEIVR